MIQIGNNKIKGAFLGKDELKYIYIGKTCVYYKETTSTGGTQGIKVCFAVVDNVNTYKDRIYDTVYSKFDNSWYILNDFNEYEKYGVYQEVNSLDKAKAITRDIYASINPNANGSWNKTQESDEFVGYESNGNFSSWNDYDLMQIDLTTGFTEFSIYMKAKGSRQRDVYAVAYNIDAAKPTRVEPWEGKDSTNKHNYDDNNTALSSYTKVDYTGIDSASTHTIYIGFGAWDPSRSKDNKGEVLIPNMPHVKIDGTTRYDGKLVENSTDKHEYEFTNGSWVDKGEITTTESVKTYPVVYEKYDDPAAILNFSTLDEANSYKGCLYPNELCKLNDETYYAVRKKDDGSFSWEETLLSYKADFDDGTTKYATGVTTINQGDISLNVVKVEIGNTVTKIGNAAFCQNPQSTNVKGASLTSVTIPNSVTSIGENAFSNCKSLSSITIPNSVTSIGGSAFDACSSLSNVILSNSLASIGSFLFSLTGIQSLLIPDSVTKLGYGAFNSCSSLSSITIPNSVTSIDSFAFGSCGSLRDINYNGTKSQWNSIKKTNSQVFYDTYSHVTVHCTDGDYKMSNSKGDI